MTAWRSMSERVQAYLAARRGMGYELRIEGEELPRFARFADQRKHRGPVTLALALAWAEATSVSRLYKAQLKVPRQNGRQEAILSSQPGGSHATWFPSYLYR